MLSLSSQRPANGVPRPSTLPPRSPWLHTPPQVERVTESISGNMNKWRHIQSQYTANYSVKRKYLNKHRIYFTCVALWLWRTAEQSRAFFLDIKPCTSGTCFRQSPLFKAHVYYRAAWMEHEPPQMFRPYTCKCIHVFPYQLCYIAIMLTRLQMSIYERYHVTDMLHQHKITLTILGCRRGDATSDRWTKSGDARCQLWRQLWRNPQE